MSEKKQRIVSLVLAILFFVSSVGFVAYYLIENNIIRKGIKTAMNESLNCLLFLSNWKCR